MATPGSAQPPSGLTCKHCGQAAHLTPTRADNLQRARHFCGFAATLGLAAAVAWFFSVWAWPWALAGMSVYVLSQAALKWHAARWLMCSGQQHAYTHWGRVPR